MAAQKAGSESRVRHEARVTPGKIVPSNGGVKTSKPTHIVSSRVAITSVRSTRTMTVRAVEHDKDIHRAPLGHLPVLAKQPQHLVVALRGCLALGEEPRGVVSADFVSAGAARPRAHGIGHSEQGEGAFEVGSAGAGDDIEDGMVGGGDADCWRR